MSTTDDALYQFGGAPVSSLLGLVPNMISGVMGRVFWVDHRNGVDGNSGRSPKDAKKTLSAAHNAMVANRNDIALVVGGSSATDSAIRESETLVWSKSMCHIVGLNAYGRISHRVSLRITSGATGFSPLLQVTGDGCVFANLHVYHGYDTAETQVAVDVLGDRNTFFNCHIAGMGHATAGDQAGSRSLLLSGASECYFKDCTIGLDTVARSTTNAELEFLFSTVSATRNIFDDCLFLAYADNLGHLFIKANTNASDIDRFALFRRCIFINPTDSAATVMTAAITNHANLTGTILLKDCTLLGATDWFAAAGKVMLDGAAPTANTSGLAVDAA